MEKIPSIEDFFLVGEPAVVIGQGVEADINAYMEEYAAESERREAVARIESESIILG